MTMETEWTTLDLVPIHVRDDTALEPLPGVIQVGRPVVLDALRLARESGRLEAEVALLAERSWFSYVRFALSMRPGDKQVIPFLAVDVALESGDAEATCWSMEPLRVEEEIKVAAEAGVTAGIGLKFLELGTEAKVTKDLVVYQPRIEAFGVGTSAPAWEFRPTDGRKLSGVQMLHLVVQQPIGGACRGEVRIAADVLKRGLLFNYRARSRNDSEVVVTFSDEATIRA